MTARPVDGPAKKPAARTAAKPKTAAAKTIAEKAAAVKSGEAKAAAAKSATARSTAAKTAAAKNAAARSAATKTAAKTTAAKTTAAKAAAAKAAAAKAAATKAAAAKAAAAAEEEAERSRTAADDEALEETTAPTTPSDESSTEAASGTPVVKPATKRTTTKKTAQAKPRTTKPRTTKPRAEKPTTRPKPVVAADAAAPASEAVASPIGDAASPAEVAPQTEDALFEDLLTAGAEPTTSESAEAETIGTEEPGSSEPVVESVESLESVESAESADGLVADDLVADDVVVDAVTVSAVIDDTVAVPASAHAVVLRDLVKDFGDHRAVNGIDLSIPAGSFYGIVGPNGAGKTTTLSIVAGLLRATSGQVVVCGIDLADDALGAKRMMGVLPDRLRTFDRLTGRQLLHYYGLLRGLASEVIEKRTADLARAFDLADALNRVVSDYSAGMTKKIMLAGAMIHSPRVLVLDEPFEAVDPVSSAVILDILRAYVAHGGTVILSSHGMDLVERVCSRVAIIVGGDVLAEGTIDEVRAGQTLEARFVELSGGIGEVEGLEWLHTFSD